MKTFKQSWFTLSCLQLSGALSLPVLMIGYYLGQHYSFHNCLLQLLLGNALLFCLSAFYALSINQEKMVTIEFAQRLFGPSGTFICAAGMVLSLLGWSAIQFHLLAAPTQQPFLAALFAGLIVYFLTCRDLAYLAQINKILLPLVLISLAYLLCSTPETKTPPPLLDSEDFRIGLMMVITAGSGLLFDLPTFYRHANTGKDALTSLALIFLFSLPLIEGLGIYLAFPLPNSTNWVQGFIHSFNLPSLLFLMVSGLLGSCLNLYSATVVIKRTLGFSYKKILFFCCLLSSLLASVDLERDFSVFLEVINLNAEIITVLILLYALFKGSQVPHPTARQKNTHQAIFYLTLSYALVSKFFRLSLFNDLFLDTAFIAGVLMSFYYLCRLTRPLAN